VKAAVGVVLDAGLFIALERRNRTAAALVQLFTERETPLVTSAGVVAQIWRGAAERRTPVAFLLKRVHVVPIDNAVARVLGRMLGETGTKDAIDAHVVLLARERGWSVLTSDPQDLLDLDPGLDLERI
jgi:predicted nucleic acid-binding protein